VISIGQARRLYEDVDGVHDFDHVLRVYRVAERIARPEGADLSIVRTAALLHDIGRAQEMKVGGDHASLAAQRVPEILAGRPAGVVAAVAHAVGAHRFRTDPQPATLEAQVLFDADKLDAIGAVGVARAFAYGGAHGQRLWVPRESVDLDRWEADGDVLLDHTPVHEFVVKLSRIRDRLFTATARAVAAERHAVMVAFFDRLSREVQGQA
jgi:uncharacterized protein